MADLHIIAPDERHFARNVDWNLFHLFVEIVQSGGISAAARHLNRQQPTVSAGLKRLEDQLGVELFHRSSQGVELTPAGRALLPLCQKMVEARAPHRMRWPKLPTCLKASSRSAQFRALSRRNLTRRLSRFIVPSRC